MSSNISPNAQFFTVASWTDPSVTYTVTQGASPGRPWMCECPAWRFARTDPNTGFKKDCKHIRGVQSLAAHGYAKHPQLHTPEGATAGTGADKVVVRKRPQARIA